MKNLAVRQPRLRSWVKWHGGKGRLVRHFLPLFRPHFGRPCFADLTFGGGALPLNLPRFAHEIFNDINPDLIRALRAVRDKGGKVREFLSGARYTRDTFEACEGLVGCEDDAVHAGAFIVRNRFSMGGRGKVFSWSERPRGGLPEGVNSWRTYVHSQFALIYDRLQGVELCSLDASEALGGLDVDRDWLIYLDPPYMAVTRTCPDVYAHEMTDSHHEQLLISAIVAAEDGAKLFISGYRSDLYDDALAAWHRHEFHVANNAASGAKKGRRVECLWESP